MEITRTERHLKPSRTLGFGFYYKLETWASFDGIRKCFQQMWAEFQGRLGSVVRESGPRYGFQWKAYETQCIFLI